MHNRAGGGDDYCVKSLDSELIDAVHTHTNLTESDVTILLEVNHTLEIVHELEGGDIFIDCPNRTGDLAVVVAQFSPKGTNYTRNIVGELMTRSNEPGVFRTLEIGVPSRKLKAVVTGEYLIRQNVSAIRRKNGDIIGVLIVERHIQGAQLWDIAETEGADSATELLKAAYDANEMESVAKYMNDGMVRFNDRGVAVYVNPSARQIYRGISYMDDIVGMPFENLAFGKLSFADIQSEGIRTHTEVKIGGYILNVMYAPMLDGDKFIGAVMIIEDMTEEKNIEKELVLKSAAIDEIHHRVKNNLQTIISLLRLQQRRILSDDARIAFSETMTRIFSISLTHEILAQKGVDEVDLREMLSRMLSSAKGYIVPENLNLTMDISGDSIMLQSDTATTIAMVVNELVQNCIKHAFPDRPAGRISLTIESGKEYSAITVADDGVGYSMEQVHEGSLGHKLVHSLVSDKLFGKIDIKTAPAEGTTVTFDFMNDSERQRRLGKEDAIRQMLEEMLPKMDAMADEDLGML